MQKFQFDLDCLLTEANHGNNRAANVDMLHSRVRFFHYTNPEAAWKILRQDRLRLFDISSMNDGSELDFYLANIAAAVGIPSPRAKPVLLKKLPTMEDVLSGADSSDAMLKPTAFILRNLARRFDNYPLIESALKVAMNWRETHDVYIVSFSEAQRDYWNEDYTGLERDSMLGVAVENDIGVADDLSLWRGYAADGAGVAVELGRGDLALRHALFFDLWHTQLHLSLVRKSSDSRVVNDALMADRTNEMRTALKEEDAQPQYRALLDTCSETAQPPSLLNRQLNLLQCRYVSGVRILRSCEDLIDDLDSALNRSFVERDVPSAAEDLIAKFLIALAAMHKHPGFSTEKEWRLVQIVKRSDGQSKMEARRGTERRYVEIELGLKYGQLSNVTKAWRFGERRPPRPLSIVLGPALNTAVVPNDVQAMIDSGILQLTQSKIPFLS